MLNWEIILKAWTKKILIAIQQTEFEKKNPNEFEKYKKPISSCINKHEIIGKTWKKPIKVGIF